MPTALITGATGLVGSESVRYFARQGLRVIGVDNDTRGALFGREGSTAWQRTMLQRDVDGYLHKDLDIRDFNGLCQLFEEFNKEITLVIHAAAQPSHDWAGRDPLTDFTINANGTLNLLELTRLYCPEAVFIFLSTNKVYGERPNALPFVESPSRWDLPPDHPMFEGVDESMRIDQSMHTLFGVSKLSADILVQEYGRYFKMKTATFRGGCLTGPNHSGVALHGFLAYLMKCCVTASEYTIYGYHGKQVRDNIHSLDLVRAFECFYREPRFGEVYNIGGGRANSCSILEAIEACQMIAGRPLRHVYSDQPRPADHKWYISRMRKFQSHYPAWKPNFSLQQILQEIFEQNHLRWEMETKQ